MELETILRDVAEMTEEEKNRTLVEVLRNNYDLNLRYQRDVGRPRMILRQLTELAKKAERGENVMDDMLNTIRFYEENY
jgi:hypothetical protein